MTDTKKRAYNEKTADSFAILQILSSSYVRNIYIRELFMFGEYVNNVWICLQERFDVGPTLRENIRTAQNLIPRLGGSRIKERQCYTSQFGPVS